MSDNDGGAVAPVTGAGRAAVMEATETSDLLLVVAGIDSDNTASQRCALAAGFAPKGDEPDREGIIYYRDRR